MKESLGPHALFFQTLLSYHFDCSVDKLVEVDTGAAVGSLQVVSSDEGVEESSNQNA